MPSEIILNVQCNQSVRAKNPLQLLLQGFGFGSLAMTYSHIRVISPYSANVPYTNVTAVYGSLLAVRYTTVKVISVAQYGVVRRFHERCTGR